VGREWYCGESEFSKDEGKAWRGEKVKKINNPLEHCGGRKGARKPKEVAERRGSGRRFGYIGVGGRRWLRFLKQTLGFIVHRFVAGVWRDRG